jgi:hypothetical protein
LIRLSSTAGHSTAGIQQLGFNNPALTTGLQ